MERPITPGSVALGGQLTRPGVVKSPTAQKPRRERAIRCSLNNAKRPTAASFRTFGQLTAGTAQRSAHGRGTGEREPHRTRDLSTAPCHDPLCSPRNRQLDFSANPRGKLSLSLPLPLSLSLSNALLLCCPARETAEIESEIEIKIVTTFFLPEVAGP